MSMATAPRATLNRKPHFALDTLFFRARDWVSPPEGKVSEVGIRPGWHVVDFGCGIGSYAIAAAKLVGESGKVYAVDLDSSRIEHVRTLAARRGLRNVHTINTDCYTALESGTIDAVLLYDVLHDLERPERVLEELSRVLRPGGILSFSDHHIREAEMLFRLTADRVFELSTTGRQTYNFRRSEGRR